MTRAHEELDVPALIRVRFKPGRRHTYTYACAFAVKVGQTVVVPASLFGGTRDARAVVTKLGSSYRGEVKNVSAVITASGGGASDERHGGVRPVAARARPGRQRRQPGQVHG